MGKKILMVCLGNICRSPIAEAVMQETIRSAGVEHEWEVDSAAIGGWHSGNLPDERALSVMKNHGLDYSNRARVIQTKDFEEFDYIFGMDYSNMAQLRRLASQTTNKAQLLMLGDFGLPPYARIIEDPYYLVGEAPFETVYDQCVLACSAFLKEVQEAKI